MAHPVTSTRGSKQGQRDRSAERQRNGRDREGAVIAAAQKGTALAIFRQWRRGRAARAGAGWNGSFRAVPRACKRKLRGWRFGFSPRCAGANGEPPGRQTRIRRTLRPPGTERWTSCCGASCRWRPSMCTAFAGCLKSRASTSSLFPAPRSRTSNWYRNTCMRWGGASTAAEAP